ncbi:DNA translocase FtsK [Bienertia sinuspersici]
MILLKKLLWFMITLLFSFVDPTLSLISLPHHQNNQRSFLSPPRHRLFTMTMMGPTTKHLSAPLPPSSASSPSPNPSPSLLAQWRPDPLP